METPSLKKRTSSFFEDVLTEPIPGICIVQPDGSILGSPEEKAYRRAVTLSFG
jgi:hypothetical protein